MGSSQENIGQGTGDVSLLFNQIYNPQGFSTCPKGKYSTRRKTKARETGEFLPLSSILKFDNAEPRIKFCVKLVSQTIVHLSMIFNLFLMKLCKDVGFNDYNDEYWSGILLGDDIYEQCIKFMVIPQYDQKALVDVDNHIYFNYIETIVEEYFGKENPTALMYGTDEDIYNYCYHYLRVNIVNRYRQRFLNMLQNTFWRRQRECVHCFVNFRFGRDVDLEDYILNRINGFTVKYNQYENDVGIANFVANHQRFIGGYNYSCHIKYQSFKVVRYFNYLSAYIGALNCPLEFNLAPLCKISLKFINIDDLTLSNIFHQPLHLSRVFDGAPKKCKKIITDGDICYYEKTKWTMRHRLQTKYPPNLRHLYRHLSLQTVDDRKWKIFITRYLEISHNVWYYLANI